MFDSVTPWAATHQPFLSFTISLSLLKLMSIESVMAPNHLILCLPPLFLPSIFCSIRVFSNDLTLYIRWPKYWSSNFCISPSNEYSGLISFRIDWFHILAVQATQESFPEPQFKSINYLVFSLLYVYMTTGKTISLTIRTFVSKVMSLLFNTLFRVVIAFLPRSKHLLILWLQDLYIYMASPS